MNKKVMSIMAAAATLIGILAVVWGAALHEHNQATDIKKAYSLAELALQKSQLAIDQQRVAWLEERIWEMEDKYGCIEDRTTDSCPGKIRRTYQRYLKEYQYLLDKISEQTTGE